MTDNFDNENKSPMDKLIEEGEQEKTQLELAREAGNTWDLGDEEMEMFVADGTAAVSIAMLHRRTKQPNGLTMIVRFKWDKDEPFTTRESNFKTVMKSLGRSTEQELDTTNMTKPNVEMFEKIVQSGVILNPNSDGSTTQTEYSREEMLEFARINPESASEVIETLLSAWKFEVMDDEDPLHYLFNDMATVKVFGYVGDRDNPLRAAILTFNTPPREERMKFEDERQIIKSNNVSDQRLAQVQQAFLKKVKYGKRFLSDVKGIAVGAPGVRYTNELKDRFVTFLNPSSFGDAVDEMHDSFAFMQGKVAGS